MPGGVSPRGLSKTPRTRAARTVATRTIRTTARIGSVVKIWGRSANDGSSFATLVRARVAGYHGNAEPGRLIVWEAVPGRAGSVCTSGGGPGLQNQWRV